MENNIVQKENNIFDKIKNFTLQNKESMTIAMAATMLIIALSDIRYAISGLGGLSGWGFGWSFASLVGIISRIIGLVGFGSMGILILTKKNNSILKAAPYLIAGSYLASAVSSLVWIAFTGSTSLVITALIQIAMGVIWILAVTNLTSQKSTDAKEKNFKLLVILPAAVFAIRILLSIVGVAYSITLINFGFALIETAALVLFVLTQYTGVTYITEEANTVENNTTYTAPQANNAANPMPEGYNEVWKVVVFSIITFGIYYLIWIYRTVGFLNRKTLEEQSQGLQLVLCMFIPFYIIYWMYKESKRVENYTIRVGNRSNDLSVISLILSIFGFSIVAVALMQDQINKNLLTEAGISTQTYPYQDPAVKPSTEVPTQVVTETKTEGTYEPKVPEAKPAQPAAGGLNNEDIEMLRKLKGLLDEGVLTAEEFETAKKAVLNK